MDYSKLVSQVDVIKQTAASSSLGSLNSNSLSGLLAQQAKSSGISSDAVVNGKLGSFGIDAKTLEAQGFLKPDVLARAGGDPTKISAILEDPGAWTGKGGVSSAADVLGDPKLQTKIQEQLLSDNFNQMKSLGLVSGTESPAQLAGLLNGSTAVGVDQLKKLSAGINIGGATNELKAAINSAKMSTALMNKIDIKSSFGSAGTQLAAVNTVDRSVADQMLKKILDDPKIPVPGDLSPGLAATSAELAAKLTAVSGLKLPSLPGLPSGIPNASAIKSAATSAAPNAKTVVSTVGKKSADFKRLLGN